MFRARAFLLLLSLLSCDTPAFGTPVYDVVVDPGHGGAPTQRNDDMWDPVTKRYLNVYNMGMKYGKHHEYQLVLQISKKVHAYLKLTESESGWKRFEEMLRVFSPQKDFQRIVLRSTMSRTDNWEDRKISEDDPHVNAPYRHYDFPAKGNANKMEPGRLSFINHTHPYLVLSIHLNPAGPGQTGGMAAVLAPGFRTFDHMRQITLGKKPRSSFSKLPWSCCWLKNQAGWNEEEVALADTWVYFHGYWTNKQNTAPWLEKNRGLRYNMISWNYRDADGWESKAAKQGPGPYAIKYAEFVPEGRFWDREKAAPEAWRREVAVPGTQTKWGGDNHYASDELMRFVQYGLRTLKPEMRKNGAIGGIVDPFVSTYGLPTLVNAISAYLEIAHLNVERDRNMVLHQQDEIARSLAVGIYSLFAGLQLRPGYKGPYRPTAKPLDFGKYENYEKGNYFKIVAD